jgi:hypothetical protein
MGDSSLWQTTWNHVLSQLTKGLPGRLDLFYHGWSKGIVTWSCV